MVGWKFHEGRKDTCLVYYTSPPLRVVSPTLSATSKYYQRSDIPISCFHSSDPAHTRTDKCSPNPTCTQCYPNHQASPWSVTMVQTQAGVKTLASSIFADGLGIFPRLGPRLKPVHSTPLKTPAYQRLTTCKGWPWLGTTDLVILLCKGEEQGRLSWEDRVGRL